MRQRAVTCALLGVLVSVLAACTSSNPSPSSSPTPDGGSPGLTDLHATADASGTYLTWTGHSADGYRIEQATDAAFTKGVHDYTVRGTTSAFTPFGLTKGVTYHFRVAGVSGSSRSGFTPAVTATPVTSEQSVRVLTYNILGTAFDGKHEGSESVLPWAQRRTGVAALITHSKPDAVSVEEAEGYVDDSHQVRQVDSLLDALGSDYALANTDTGPVDVNPLVGNYILYRPATLTPLDRGGFWQLGAGGKIQRAAYQAFRSKVTGAGFVFVALHLGSVRGAQIDARRTVQTKSLLTKAAAYAAQVGVHAIVYSGDYNTYPGRPGFPDTPGDVMRAARVVDGIEVAQSLSNQRYDTMNNYYRMPPQGNGSIDRVFTTAGVGVVGWHEVLELTNGKFVGTIPSDHNPVYVDLTIPY